MSQSLATPLDTTRPAVILGVEHPRGLAVLRSLATSGVSTVVVDRYRYAPGLYSRLPHRKFRLDTDDAEETLRFLETMDGVDGAVLMPTNDFYMSIVGANIPRLSRRFVLTTAPWDILDPVLDKARLFRMIRSTSVATPSFHEPDSFEALEAILSALDFEGRRYIFSLPPTCPEPADPRTIRFTIPAGDDLETARGRAAELFSRAGTLPIVQEVILGGADCCLGVVMLVDDAHRPLGWRTVRRKKLYQYFNVEGYSYGGNVCCESIHDDEAVAAAAEVVARTKLTGVVMVEFRRRLDGGLVLMKVDTRVVGMAGLCPALDFDLPTLLYRLRTGQPVSVSPSYPDGLIWVWEKPYVWGMLKGGLRAWREIPAALDTFRRATALGVWSADDPWPFLWNAAGGVRSQVRKRFLQQRSLNRSNRWEDTPTRPLDAASVPRHQPAAAHEVVPPSAQRVVRDMTMTE